MYNAIVVGARSARALCTDRPGRVLSGTAACPKKLSELILLTRSLPLSHPRPSGHVIYVAASQLAPFSLTISTECY